MSDGTPSSDSTSVVKGFLLGIVLHILFQSAFVVLVVVFVKVRFAVLWVIYLYGLTQLLYMIPAVLIAWKRRANSIAKGLIIAAAYAFLLNAACDGLMFLSR